MKKGWSHEGTLRQSSLHSSGGPAGVVLKGVSKCKLHPSQTQKQLAGVDAVICLYGCINGKRSAPLWLLPLLVFIGREITAVDSLKRSKMSKLPE